VSFYQQGHSYNLTKSTMVKTRGTAYELLDAAVKGAYDICKDIPMYKAVKMKERDIRKYLDENSITTRELQDTYLNSIRLYDLLSKDYI
jgi:uncharacterized protein YutE (UPF0331/DUF86 family)